jgi:hypothetical protein
MKLPLYELNIKNMATLVICDNISDKFRINGIYSSGEKIYTNGSLNDIIINLWLLPNSQYRLKQLNGSRLYKVLPKWRIYLGLEY